MLYLVSNNEDLTRRTIKLAVAAYCSSSTIEEVHDRIKKYDGYLPLLNRMDQETLAMIEGLMNEFSIEASEIPGLRAKIPVINSQPDEPWCWVYIACLFITQMNCTLLVFDDYLLLRVSFMIEIRMKRYRRASAQ